MSLFVLRSMGTPLAATEMLPVLKSETKKTKTKYAGLVHFIPFSGFAYNTLSPTCCFFLKSIHIKSVRNVPWKPQTSSKNASH